MRYSEVPAVFFLIFHCKYIALLGGKKVWTFEQIVLQTAITSKKEKRKRKKEKMAGTK
jgi:hypothetical protein